MSKSKLVNQTKVTLKAQPTWWTIVIFVSFVHLVSVVSTISYSPKPNTIWLVFWLWVVGTLSITMGYHRLWSHHAYQANLGVRIALSLSGVVAWQGSIKWWSLRHRLHHRYTDTEHDPYDATRGFWYSHMGWLFERPVYTRLKWIDKSDLDADPGMF
jgi:stearoyl-CoA desaturase (delta-9 desaturase)